jgi:hypothetical protein
MAITQHHDHRLSCGEPAGCIDRKPVDHPQGEEATLQAVPQATL